MNLTSIERLPHGEIPQNVQAILLVNVRVLRDYGKGNQREPEWAASLLSD